MVPGAEQLRDIRGLDPTPWWPPAPIWWLVLAAVLVLIGIAWAFRAHHRYEVGGHWRAEARSLLHGIRRQVGRADARLLLGQLTELLRRVAMQRYGRRDCAALTGEPWLAWLEQHDPGRFPWRAKGRVLIEVPYAPPGEAVPPATLLRLVDAVEPWLSTVTDASSGAAGRSTGEQHA